MDANETYLKSSYDEIEKDFQKKSKIVDQLPKIKQILFVLWAAIDIALLALFIGFIGWYITTGIFAEKRTVARIGLNVDSQRSVTAQNQAEPLVIQDARILSSGDRKDFVAEIENGNADWFAEFRYYFTTSNGSTDFKRGFALPGQKHTLVALGQDIDGGGNAELVIEDVMWRRITAREIANFDVWLAEHSDIDVTNITHGPGPVVGERTLTQTAFTVTNNSPYSYREANFVLTLRRGTTVIAVNTVQLPSLESGEERQVNVNWFDGAPAAGTPIVELYVNFFDEDAYIANPEGDAVEVIDVL